MPSTPGQEQRGVFQVLGVLRRTDAGVGQRYNDLRALLLHLRHPCLGRLDDVARHRLALEVSRIPGHDLRRHEPDQADTDRMLGAGAVLDLLVKDHIRLQEKLVLGGVGCEFALGQIGADEREVRAVEHLEQEIEPIIELVIAHGRAVVAQHIHSLDDRVNVAVLHAALIGDVIAHWVALQEVAIVDEDRIGRLGADGVDDRGGARDAHRVVRLVGVIVVREDVNVQVGRFHDPQMRLVGLGARGKRMQDDQRTSRGGAGEECAPGNGVKHRRHCSCSSLEAIAADTVAPET